MAVCRVSPLLVVSRVQLTDIHSPASRDGEPPERTGIVTKY